ncbi:MAG: glutathione S-transferase family protein [bacterium]|nr:glutathione S-transferase family protein [Gammaproteobacteria bacterium]HIL98389.1 glutathione S-transferase family protein [Pseudomonadales bacterium]
MIKLHGMSRSNYSGLIKAVLIEKGIEFEDINAMPSQEEDYLSISPMGKVPCLETEAGFISETSAIIEYLEETFPDKPLLPSDPFERAKVRELLLHIELDIELVARKAIMFAFGRPVKEEVVKQIKKELPRGSAAVARLVKFEPYIAGSEFTVADLVGYFSYKLANIISVGAAELDLLDLVPGSKVWFDMIAERDSVKEVEAVAA